MEPEPRLNDEFNKVEVEDKSTEIKAGTPTSEIERPRVKKRRISKKGRARMGRNAVIGTVNWEKESHKKRVEHRKHPPVSHTWGFKGRSPRTRKRERKHAKQTGL